uniref:HD domain-containing protein n=1 Tax=Lysinibacillus sp. D4B1_S16 TaxID=2941231 RepID=UPI0020BFADFC
EHSRFSNSLGVYEIVHRIVNDIFVGRPDWDEGERLLVLCAALLHDLGHGPFSHAFENDFELDHDHYTREIL